MAILGLLLLIAGIVLGIHLLYAVGAIILVIGLILLVLSFTMSAPVGGRRYW